MKTADMKTTDMTTRLEVGDMLPFVQLQPVGGGRAVKIGSNQSRAQVLVLTHRDPCDDCARYLKSFEAETERLRDEKADVLAVVGPGWGDPVAPAPVKAVVGEGRIVERLAPDGNPVVVVADRYGQMFVVIDAGCEHDFPDHEPLIKALIDIGIRCPECGVPDVPSPDFLPEEGTRSGGMYLGQ